MTISMTFPLNSIWKLERRTDKSSSEQVFQIKIIESTESNFIGKYINKNNDDDVTFYGEFRRKQREIISIKHHQENSTYYAFYQGFEVPTGLFRYTGHWADVNGKDGEFKIVMLSND